MLFLKKNEKEEEEKVSNKPAFNTSLQTRAWPAEHWGKGGDPRFSSSSAGSESQPEHDSTGPGCCENVKCQYEDVYAER